MKSTLLTVLEELYKRVSDEKPVVGIFYAPIK